MSSFFKLSAFLFFGIVFFSSVAFSKDTMMNNSVPGAGSSNSSSETGSLPQDYSGYSKSYSYSDSQTRHWEKSAHTGKSISKMADAGKLTSPVKNPLPVIKSRSEVPNTEVFESEHVKNPLSPVSSGSDPLKAVRQAENVARISQIGNNANKEDESETDSGTVKTISEKL